MAAAAKTFTDGAHAIVVAQVISVAKMDPLAVTVYTAALGALRWTFATAAERDTFFTNLVAAMNA